ncbi:ATP-binding cassette domain-containing protein [Actinomyces sp. B33]|uniref:ABC transporter ATP-binding protein n=1 Tax=Actinomyces sp. B33 TaxID=2942131 RepID=UPI002341F9B6|nr:ATP-binding cassette domain-containing protein [Actinomyces sp. B33]MDC4233452.1 ATP-binding cassette domain-containing protein [Actinomyces sp. B33]
MTTPPMSPAAHAVSSIASDAVIEVQGLTKRYDGRAVVDDVSFTVHPGLVTGFLGPNGAGKSTTMKMILGLVSPTSGHALISKQDFRDLANPAASIGALLDPNAVQGFRTGTQHLMWQARAAGIAPTAVKEKLDLVGLSDAADRKVSGYSLGMRQRLALAGALLADPAILILDEPINGLDPEGILWMRQTLKRLAAEGRTVFVSSHLMDEMERTADRVIIIDRGRLIEDVTLSQLTTQSVNHRVSVRSGDDEALAAALSKASGKVERDETGMVVTGLTPEQIGRLALEARVPLERLHAKETTLENAFLQITRMAENESGATR